jgi:hypothetical protein
MAREERTQIIRSFDHIGAAGIRLRGDARLEGGADVCAKQAMDIKRDKPTDQEIGHKQRSNFLNCELNVNR